MSPAGATAASAVLLTGVGGVGREKEVSVEMLPGVLGADAPPKTLPLMSAIDGACTHRHNMEGGRGVSMHRRRYLLGGW